MADQSYNIFALIIAVFTGIGIIWQFVVSEINKKDKLIASKDEIIKGYEEKLNHRIEQLDREYKKELENQKNEYTTALNNSDIKITKLTELLYSFAFDLQKIHKNSDEAETISLSENLLKHLKEINNSIKT